LLIIEITVTAHAKILGRNAKVGSANIEHPIKATYEKTASHFPCQHVGWR
jgi:hypothetical protein